MSISLSRPVVNEMPGKRIVVEAINHHDHMASLLVSALEKELSEALNNQGNHDHKTPKFV